MEIRCRSIILARKDEPTPDYAREKMNRHRITRHSAISVVSIRPHMAPGVKAARTRPGRPIPPHRSRTR